MAFTENATQVNKTETEGSYYNYAGIPAPSSLNWYPELAAGTTRWCDAGCLEYLGQQ
jgi:hypothetical protein